MPVRRVIIGAYALMGAIVAACGFMQTAGALIMASLLNDMTLMAVSPEAKYIARGVVLALAVWLDLKLGHGR